MKIEESRFWSHVNVAGPLECWPWTAALRRGYGTMKLQAGDFDSPKRKDSYAHRIAFYITYGRWPVPVARHTCDNPVCCNPSHVIEGTHKQNMEDKYVRGRAVHPTGVLSARSVFTSEDVELIRSTYALGGTSQREIAERFGVSQTCISRVVTKVRYK